MTKHNITVLTIFPEMFPGPLGLSLAGRSLKDSIWSLNVINIRDFGLTKHHNVDDTQSGGGSGLVMRPDVLGKALDYALSSVKNSNSNSKESQGIKVPIFYPSPRGKKFDQSVAKSLATIQDIIILCGRFEGIDQRVIEEYNMQEISIGDYVLSGGEIAAYAMIDSVVRLIPGVISNSDTIKDESFETIGIRQRVGHDFKVEIEEVSSDQLLEYPLYTKPRIWKGRSVPDVLLSGDHKKIDDWRYEQSLKITKLRRPDLLESKSKN